MPRYYFHHRAGDKRMWTDADGFDCADHDAALSEARIAARDMVIEALKFEKDDLPDGIVVMDGEGLEIGRVAMVDVLPPSLKRCDPLATN